jgi:hypothetical protein
MKLPTTIKAMLGLAALAVSWGVSSATAATITLVGNGAGGGPVFVTSGLTNINLGTRLRVGTFLDLTSLNNTISAFKSGATDYSNTLLALNSNFSDLATGVTNYGNASQTGTGVSSSQVVFNTTANLAINGAASTAYNVFNGSIQSVTYSSSIGASKNLYIWTAFNNEIGIVRNANGTGTAAWTTPTSDLSGVTLNLSGLQASTGGALDSSEILLGTGYDYSTGSDLIALQAAVPEPTTSVLIMLGGMVVLAMRRKES